MLLQPNVFQLNRNKEVRDPDFPAHDANTICAFLSYLDDLAPGLNGELALVAIEQRPDQRDKHLRTHRFAVGNCSAMAKVALEEAAQDWVNVYFGSYVVRKGLAPNSRGCHEDIIGVLMLGVDQDADTGREGALPLEPNVIVRTSHIPAVNRQAFYVFDPQCRPSVDEARQVGEVLRAATGADSGTGDIAL